MKKFKRKPAVIEAIQYTGSNGLELHKWSNGAVIESPVVQPNEYSPTGAYVQIKTIDTSYSWATAVVGDWIIKGTHSEFYPCRNNIFIEIYEPIE